MSFNPVISRRQLLQALGVGSAGALLTDCAGTEIGGTNTQNNSGGDSGTIVWWSNHPANSRDVELELISGLRRKIRTSKFSWWMQARIMPKFLSGSTQL